MEADLLWLLSLSRPLDWKLFPLSSTCPESFSTRPCTWLGSFEIKGPTSQIASGSGLQQNNRNEYIKFNGPTSRIESGSGLKQNNNNVCIEIERPTSLIDTCSIWVRFITLSVQSSGTCDKCPKNLILSENYEIFRNW